MNMRQVWGAAGGFFFVFILITLTNKPSVGPRERKETPAPEATQAAGSEAGQASGQPAAAVGDRLRGFTLLPPDGKAFAGSRLPDAMRGLQGAGAGWVAFAPVMTQPTARAEALPAPPEAAVADVREAVKAAKAASLKVFLRPIVLAEDGARGDALDPPDAAKWLESYGQAMAPWLAMAEGEGVELVSIGSKLGKLQADPAWTKLIADARGAYKGKLTYAAAPDAATGYGQVGFWKELDYVGIDAYFPLTEVVGPQAKDLEGGWQKAAEGIESWRTAAVVDKPVLFTSAGVPHLVGGAALPADPNLSAPDDDKLQAGAYEAFFKTVWARPWVAGVFWHTWSGFDNRQNPYAIDGHPALDVVRTHFAGAAN